MFVIKNRHGRPTDLTTKNNGCPATPQDICVVSMQNKDKCLSFFYNLPVSIQRRRPHLHNGMVRFLDNKRHLVSMRVGRFLKKYTDWDARKIELLASLETTAEVPEGLFVFSLASTPDEIERVYAERSIDSCMTGRTGARAYGAGDLAIAYLADPETNTVLARAICWPDRKILGPVYSGPAYSQEVSRKALLKMSGFRFYQRSEDFAGAALNLAEGQGDYPYLDVGYADWENNRIEA